MTRPTSVPNWAKPLIVLGAAAVLAVAALQVAGLIFAGLTSALKPQDVTPITFYRYWYWYRSQPLWQSYVYSSGAVGMLALLMPVAVVLAPGRRQRLHGEARWARRGQIRTAGLMGSDGIIVGKLGSRFLMFNGNEQGKNVIVAAAPGSGKTQGLMIPNCLNWPGSLVALDIKGECYERTSGFRAAMGQAVFKVEFLSRDYRTHQYNPFAYVSEDKNFRVGDIERIAHYLLPNPPGPGGDPFWATSARDMFRAIALYLLETTQTCTLGAILEVADTPEELQTFARRVVREAAAGTSTVDAQTVRDFSTIAHRPEKTHGGVKDNLTGALAPLKNPLVRYATDGNSFDLRALRAQRMSVYMSVKKPDLTPLRPIINLFFQQLVDLSSMVEYGKDPSHRHEVLLGMDEFAQLGRLDAIFEGVTFFRSFGLRLLAILQSPSQLRSNYSIEGAKTFEQSFDCSVFYTPSPRDIETAELISKLLGNNTVKGRSESKRKGFETKHDSISTSDQKRALMLPQEVMRIPSTKQIIVISGLAPIFASKVRAWAEPMLLTRTGAPPTAPKVQIAIGSTRVDVSSLPVAESLRSIAPADMSALESIELADFATNLSEIDIPRGELSAAEVERLASEFVAMATGEDDTLAPGRGMGV